MNTYLADFINKGEYEGVYVEASSPEEAKINFLKAIDLGNLPWIYVAEDMQIFKTVMYPSKDAKRVRSDGGYR